MASLSQSGHSAQNPISERYRDFATTTLVVSWCRVLDCLYVAVSPAHLRPRLTGLLGDVDCCKMTTQNHIERLSTQLPNLRFGFGLAIVLFVLEIVWGVQQELARGTPEAHSAGGYTAALTLAGAFVSTAYVLHCVSAYHYVVNNVDGWSHPISPKRAVRFHFIPVFNLYWDFKWPREIARFVNWRTQSNRMSGIMVGALVLIGFLIGGFFYVSIGLAVIVSAFAYISRCLRDAFAASPVTPELQALNAVQARTIGQGLSLRGHSTQNPSMSDMAIFQQLFLQYVLP